MNEEDGVSWIMQLRLMIVLVGCGRARREIDTRPAVCRFNYSHDTPPPAASSACCQIKSK